MDTAGLPALRAPVYRKPVDDGILKIAHAPTNRGIKSTVALQRAVDRLRKEGAPYSSISLSAALTWNACGGRARADLFVDQVLLGYGCNAIEAWGMGIPVIAGVDPEKATAIVKQYIPPNTRDCHASHMGRATLL